PSAPDNGVRAVPARPRARSVFEVVRRAQDARAHSIHAEDGKAAAQLSRGPIQQNRFERAVDIVDRGTGTPLVLIPGLQGRWEYMRATVDALATMFRVVTFSLCGERASGLPCDSAHGLEDYAAQVAAALEEKGLDRAVICGISFGGLVALRFA